MDCICFLFSLVVVACCWLMIHPMHDLTGRRFPYVTSLSRWPQLLPSWTIWQSWVVTESFSFSVPEKLIQTFVTTDCVNLLVAEYFYSFFGSIWETFQVGFSKESSHSRTACSRTQKKLLSHKFSWIYTAPDLGFLMVSILILILRLLQKSVTCVVWTEIGCSFLLYGLNLCQG